MANLHQLNITYIPGEDRLLFKMSTKDETGLDEFRLWLTRRFVILLWQTLDRMLTSTLAEDPLVSTSNQESMKQFQEEAAMYGADFSSPYGADCIPRTPLGEEPLLASKIQVRQPESGQQILTMSRDDGLGVNLALNISMLHSLRKLLRDGATMAQWNLNLQAAPPMAAAGVPGTTKPRAIN